MAMGTWSTAAFAGPSPKMPSKGAAPKTEAAGNRPHHNPAFTIDEDAMLIGASIFVQLVENRLASPQ